jgi:NAD(P)-dependent dehydrogenase (short-subunit alcohol dehydrogenase family)
MTDDERHGAKVAIEYAARGIRVNAVSLGIIATSPLDDEARRAFGAHHPLGRVGEVGKVVDGILFLESTEHPAPGTAGRQGLAIASEC